MVLRRGGVIDVILALTTVGSADIDFATAGLGAIKSDVERDVRTDPATEVETELLS